MTMKYLLKIHVFTVLMGVFFTLGLFVFGSIAMSSEPAASVPVTSTTLPNPLSQRTVQGILGNVIRVALGALGSVTLMMMIWGGAQWMTSAGSAEKVKKGTQTMMWAAIGAILTLSSYILVNYVIRIFTNSPQ